MKKFRIPCSWEMYAVVDVEAENIEDAIDIVDKMNLPENGEYVQASFAIDETVLDLYNEE